MPSSKVDLPVPFSPADDRDGSIETQLETVPQKGQAKRVGIGLGDAILIEPNPPKVRRGQPDGSISP